jgi:signal transduction histidine kinase
MRAQPSARQLLATAPMTESFFDEMRRYVGFGPDDGAALLWLATHAESHLDAIVDEFYHRLAQHDDARKVIGDEEHIGRLKRTLKEWLRRVLEGPWDEEYYQSRVQIGRTHVRVGLPQRYMIAAMTSIRLALTRIVDTTPTDRETRQRATIAVARILDLELAIMLESYAIASVERRLAERARRQSRLESLGTMVAGLAHEIRNPLNAANLQLTLLDRRLSRVPPDLDGARETTHLAGIEIGRLDTLLADFLKFARPQPIVTSMGDLGAIVASVVGLLQPEATAASVDLSADVRFDVRTEFDPDRMTQVLHNLVRNAIQATPHGGAVVVRAAMVEDHAVIEVEDSGPGPAPDAPVFEPFYTTKPTGTGLGLSIVHRIVTDHDGTVDVFRRAGKTVFAVHLPVRE